MKILALCSAGVVRSHALVAVLKLDYGRDALAAGIDRNQVDTLAMLLNWSERVVVMQPYMLERIPSRYRNTACVCDVGPDVYGNPFCPRLVTYVRDFAAKWTQAGTPAGFRIKYV